MLTGACDSFVCMLEVFISRIKFNEINNEILLELLGILFKEEECSIIWLCEDTLLFLRMRKSHRK